MIQSDHDAEEEADSGGRHWKEGRKVQVMKSAVVNVLAEGKKKKVNVCFIKILGSSSFLPTMICL